MQRCVHVLSLATLMLAAGCVQIEQNLTLNPDGSGVVRLTYVASEDTGSLAQQTAREMLRQTLALSGGTARLPQDMTDAEIRTQFAGYAKYGVQLDQLHTEHRQGCAIRRGVISFKTLSGLARALVPERTVALTRDARGNYILLQQPGGGDSLVNRFAAVAADEAKPLVAELFRSFRATVKVAVPGRVLEANATQTEQASATWRFDSDKEPQALANALQRPMRLTFEGHGLNLAPFVHKAGTP